MISFCKHKIDQNTAIATQKQQDCFEPLFHSFLLKVVQVVQVSLKWEHQYAFQTKRSSRCSLKGIAHLCVPHALPPWISTHVFSVALHENLKESLNTCFLFVASLARVRWKAQETDRQRDRQRDRGSDFHHRNHNYSSGNNKDLSQKQNNNKSHWPRYVSECSEKRTESSGLWVFASWVDTTIMQKTGPNTQNHGHFYRLRSHFRGLLCVQAWHWPSKNNSDGTPKISMDLQNEMSTSDLRLRKCALLLSDTQKTFQIVLPMICQNLLWEKSCSVMKTETTCSCPGAKFPDDSCDETSLWVSDSPQPILDHSFQMFPRESTFPFVSKAPDCWLNYSKCQQQTGLKALCFVCLTTRYSTEQW